MCGTEQLSSFGRSTHELRVHFKEARGARYHRVSGVSKTSGSHASARSSHVASHATSKTFVPNSWQSDHTPCVAKYRRTMATTPIGLSDHRGGSPDSDRRYLRRRCMSSSHARGHTARTTASTEYHAWYSASRHRIALVATTHSYNSKVVFALLRFVCIVRS
jgi:hypothetical protein